MNIHAISSENVTISHWFPFVYNSTPGTALIEIAQNGRWHIPEICIMERRKLINADADLFPRIHSHLLRYHDTALAIFIVSRGGVIHDRERTS